MRKHKQQTGFVLISLVLALVIIAILVVLYLKPGNEGKNVVETGRKAEDQLNDSSQKMQNYQTQLNEQQQNIDIQNNLNSIGQ